MAGLIPKGAPLEAYRELIESALDHAGTHHFEDVKQAIEDGRATHWPAGHSIIVTEVVEHPLTKWLHFWIAAGEREELRRMQPIILEWGRDQGCTKASMTGRAGWERLLTPYGWQKDPAITFTKNL
jgi:hypothetical protein